MNAWMGLLSGLSLLVGVLLGAWFYAWWLHRKGNVRLRKPARWPLRVRGIVNGNEKEVWNWLRSNFHDHVVLVKMPILRYTMLTDAKKANRNGTARANADYRTESERMQELLNSIYTTFTICTMNGKVVGCVDVTGKSELAPVNRELKEMLLLDCDIAYAVLSASSLPDAISLRALFLGEIPVEPVEHQVTHGGDSDFHADMRSFIAQQAKAN